MKMRKVVALFMVAALSAGLLAAPGVPSPRLHPPFLRFLKACCLFPAARRQLMTAGGFSRSHI